MSGIFSVSQVGLVAMALLKIKGVGAKTVLDNLEKPTNLVNHRDVETWFYDICVQINKDDEANRAWDIACRQAEDCERVEVKPLCFVDAEYPVRLRGIPDPPAMIYVKGSVSALHSESSVAIVGTLNPTGFGFKVARRFGSIAAKSGVCVVSGLARGCDTAAHSGCVDANGVGVAVLAHGLDMVYPAANRALADDLIIEGGCLVSEYPVGVKPFPKAFALRDRIQSGLSDGVMVVETPLQDGTMHTVNAANKQKRIVGCLQHPERFQSEPQIQGNLRIIQKGAYVVPKYEIFQNFLECLSQRSNVTEIYRNDTALYDAPVQGQWDLEEL